jgi:putative PIG3 family NAD(P)H quinone oxidoreductase
MRAVVVDPGARPQDMRLAQVPDPEAGPGEVLLDVAATAVNRADLLQRRGRYPPPPGESEILGLEAAGVVSGLGPGTQGWAVGDRAMALLAGGGYAERVAVPAGQLMPVPPAMSLTDAAAIPEAFLTAWMSLRDLTRVRHGEVLLIHAAASGVGTAAIQVGRELGARVFGTTRTAAKAEAIGRFGGEAICAPDGRFAETLRAATGGHGADAVLDLVGAALWPETLRSLAVGARVSVIGLVGGARIELDLATLMGLQAQIHVTSLRRRTRDEKAALVAGFREWASPRLSDGRLAPVIHEVMPLEGVSAAHRLLEDDATVGKVVLRVRG